MCHGEQGGAGEDVCVCVMVVLVGALHLWGNPASQQRQTPASPRGSGAAALPPTAAEPTPTTPHSPPPQKPQRWCCSNKPSSSTTPMFSSVSCSLRWSREQGQTPPGSSGGNSEHSLPAPTAPALASCCRKHLFFSGLIYSVSRAEKRSAAISICHRVSRPVRPGETSRELSLAKLALTRRTHHTELSGSFSNLCLHVNILSSYLPQKREQH